ncbi:MAG: hypothetical protein PHQ89_05900 [Bacilli bacterium]|nr:hypothetical protein [Bacilli bacterium]
MLRNDSGSTITLVVYSNIDEVYEVQIGRNQYIKIPLFDGDSISFSCVECAEDLKVVIFRHIGGD